MNKEKLPFITKTVLFSTLLFIESLLITTTLWSHIRSGDLLSVDALFVVKLGVLMLLMTYTYALTIGAWDVWLQYVIVPLPISLAILLVVATISIPYALLISTSIYAIMAYDVFFATRLKDQLINFNPRLILRFSTKGMLFIYALVSALMVLIGPDINYDLGNSLAMLFQDEVAAIMGNVESYRQLDEAGLVNVDFGNIISSTVNDFIAPYAKFIVPLIAVLTLISISMLEWIVFVLFSITIDIVFYFARRYNVVHSEYRDVKQEYIRF